MPELAGEWIRLDVDCTGGGTGSFSCPGWPDFRLAGLRPTVRLDGKDLTPTACRTHREPGRTLLSVAYDLSGKARLSMSFFLLERRAVHVRTSLCNLADHKVELNHLTLLGAGPQDAPLSLGAAGSVRVLEQGNYWGRVRSLDRPPAPGAAPGTGEPNAAEEQIDAASDLFSVTYDGAARRAFLAGFTTSERWLGRVRVVTRAEGQVQRWALEMDGGDLEIAPGQELDVEEVILVIGSDPHELMEWYGDRIAARHQPRVPEKAPVSWCSWYPHRLSVTQTRVLDNARIAAQRLKPLGLTVMEVDLGWEKGNLPSAFEENERFPSGLRWLADELGKLGLDLGVWKAPFTISEFDPVAQEHPEWLVQGEDGKPAAYWTWYWEPHGKVFILDLTHPGARTWLAEKVGSLRERGVRYLKSDFIGCVSGSLAKHRHDRTMVGGGGCEAARRAAQIIRHGLPEALLLNCGGPEMPGTGHWPLLYTCNDTGNTGFIGHAAQQANYLTLACHLFKNHRWGIVQPSCLCVGLPGTLDDARLRATAAFLSGGQIDVGDDLTCLPEERWAVLTASLPSLPHGARAIDLFEPVGEPGAYDYSAVTQGRGQSQGNGREHPPGSVWHGRVQTEWDEWDLVAVFAFTPGASAESPQISRFGIPLERLGIPYTQQRWCFEFWSGQFVGPVPGGRVNEGGYSHPGDFQELRAGTQAGMLDLAFFGPCVKLLCLRRPRPHPWVVGTTFHQSCGSELVQVAWDQGEGALRGLVQRPAGESGTVVVAGAGRTALAATVDGRPVPLRSGAHGSAVLPLTVGDQPAAWEVKFG
ncbi:MAG: alpha-galactosidase [Candidatus Latescibacterota bacterium]